MILLLGFFVGTLLYYSHEDFIITTRPTIYPTTTAWDPSSGPLCTWTPPHAPPDCPVAAPPDYAGQTIYQSTSNLPPSLPEGCPCPTPPWPPDPRSPRTSSWCSRPSSACLSPELLPSSRKTAASPWLSSEDRNVYAKMTYGNRAQRGHGIKLLHWNKGPSFLQNKHQELETIIGGHTPHVLGLLRPI